MKKRSLGKLALVFSLVLCIILICIIRHTGILRFSETEKVTEKTNLYKTVNKEWLAKTTLKPGQSNTGAFAELEEKVDNRLKADMKKMASGELVTTNAEQEKMVAYYKQALNRHLILINEIKMG
ncbi:hypothetical protein ACVR0A_05695 [Streptococcus downei]|uniref:Neutral endopeptidase n=1 Tax=Streptococcus downei MFe28 TaxID=764290 RepID=A0A380JG48_STRDO|nr:hypothetical protein [Streptococcus downei]SUN37369.1 Neutral endopeptidase [Streptococcus downei MFe28]